MSIYATLWVLKLPRDGDARPGCEWVKVMGQGVPAHIGTPTPGYGYESGDPYAAFLPPAIPVPEGEECLKQPHAPQICFLRRSRTISDPT